MSRFLIYSPIFVNTFNDFVSHIQFTWNFLYESLHSPLN